MVSTQECPPMAVAKKSISLTLNAERLKKLAAQAEREEISLSQLIDRMLREHMEADAKAKSDRR